MLGGIHLDRTDLSPVRLPPEAAAGAPGWAKTKAAAWAKKKGVDGGGEAAATTTMPLMTVLQSTIEHSVPDWVEQARRLGGLLIGVGSQAGRPISLSAEWRAIADQALAAEGKIDARRLRTTRAGAKSVLKGSQTSTLVMSIKRWRLKKPS